MKRTLSQESCCSISIRNNPDMPNQDDPPNDLISSYFLFFLLPVVFSCDRGFGVVGFSSMITLGVRFFLIRIGAGAIASDEPLAFFGANSVMLLFDFALHPPFLVNGYCFVASESVVFSL